MYEELRKEVDWEHQHPDGEALHVADIWESEEHSNKFVTSRLLPIMKKINMPIPEGEIFSNQ